MIPLDVGPAGHSPEPPCIAGEHYPNDDGTACAYCGLPAVTMTDAEELRQDAADVDARHDDADRWQDIRARRASAN